MRSLNQVQLIGNLGSDPETRFMPDSTQVTNFSVATSTSWKDKNGNQQESTEWHKCVAFKHLAEICSEHLGKGDKVFIQGRLKTSSWDKDGHKFFKTEVIIKEMLMLPKGNHAEETPRTSGKEAAAGDFSDNNFDDDIPF